MYRTCNRKIDKDERIRTQEHRSRSQASWPRTYLLGVNIFYSNWYSESAIIINQYFHTFIFSYNPSFVTFYKGKNINSKLYNIICSSQVIFFELFQFKNIYNFERIVSFLKYQHFRCLNVWFSLNKIFQNWISESL